MAEVLLALLFWRRTESLAALGALNVECVYPSEMFGRYRVTAFLADRV
jgi:hypothetical protein